MKRSAVSQIHTQIEKNLGDCVLSQGPLVQKSLEGTVPLVTVAPKTEQQVAELVALCNSGDVMVIAAGTGHQLQGLRRANDARPFVLLSTQNLKQVIGYSYEDMTITVQSGVLLSELDEITNVFGQHLPVDPPYAETATLGGLVGTNAWGPRRLIHGTTADCVLGGAMVLADGSLVKSGAKTVKSVAGYDLHKLFVGSFGSLGIITQVTLKLKPIPEDFRIVKLTLDNVAAGEYAVGQLVRGQTRPSMIDLLNSKGARLLGHELRAEEVLLCVGYEDSADSVDWQVKQVKASFGESRLIVLDQEKSLVEYKRIVEWPVQSCHYSFEAVMLGSRCGALIDYCNQHQIGALARIVNGLIQGCGEGLVTHEVAKTLRQLAGPNGTIKFNTLSPGSSISRWGEMDQARKWMREIKEKFDPQGIFPWPGFLGQ